MVERSTAKRSHARTTKTTFEEGDTQDLPRVQDEDPGSAQAPERAFAILVVDDDEINRQILCRFLASEGFEVRSAVDGPSALASLRAEVIDLVLLDILMPHITGVDVLRALREVAPPETLPVIMATSVDDSEEIVKAFGFGANDYITKPFDLPVVLARVRAQLRARQPRGTSVGADPVQASLPLPHGTVLAGRYRIEGEIGSGSIGIVYRATHLQLDLPVAVKVLRMGLGVEPETLSRFQAEGVSAGRLRHPNVVSVIDSGITAGGVAYLAMELLQGETLEALLDREQRLDLERCARILSPVCSALAEAHSLGMVHRDIKPGNLFLDRSRGVELVKVLDFGLAKLVGDAALTQKLTLAGSVLGTPAYMAPERFEGTDYDGRADVYSLGVLLFEMLTGDLPFFTSDGNPIRLAMMHLQHPAPAPSSRLPDLPPAVDDLVLAALAKRGEDRPSASEFGRRLASAVQGA